MTPYGKKYIDNSLSFNYLHWVSNHSEYCFTMGVIDLRRYRFAHDLYLDCKV